MNINPFLATDGYKTGHQKMYPQGTTLVYSNFTPRHGKHTNVEGGKGVISFGQQMVMRQIKEMFDEHFFNPQEARSFYESQQETESTVRAIRELRDKVCQPIKKEYSIYLGEDFDVSHIEALWDLGYLPIKVKALPEGSFVPYGVPVLTIHNTKPEFFWLTNFLETLISNMLWMPMTSATTAFDYKKTLVEAAKKTDKEALSFVDFQGHNFSMRGMAGLDATVYSGLGHSTSFLGDDSLPTIHAARKFYDETGAVVHSVNATEHSVMCAGEKDDELGTFRYLMKQFPTGILSIVSDTWDLWKVLTEYLPQLKDEILTRDGKIVIRPDSGDPVEIICGLDMSVKWNKENRQNLIDREESLGRSGAQFKGVIELLWDIFGGTVNEQGYKVLNPKIGAIYGDSITPKRAKEICKRLEAKGFASTNIVLGIGSYTYQYVTRDTHGFAMKATYVEVKENLYHSPEPDRVVGREIFKDPITSDGSKKSAKGLLAVQRTRPSNEYQLYDQVDWKIEGLGDLQTIFEDGNFYNQVSLSQIRERINNLI